MNYTSLQIPLQLLATKYRTCNHDTDRILRSIIKRLLRMLKSQMIEQQSVAEEIALEKQDLLILKRKLSQSCLAQLSLYDICRKRLHRQGELSKCKVKKRHIKDSQRDSLEFNTQIIQYLRSRNQFDRARALQKALKQEAMFCVETDLLQDYFNISRDINDNNLKSLKQWIYENAHNLDKISNSIEFQLTACQYVNLIVMGQTMAACQLLRNCIKKTQLNKIQQKTIQKLAFLLIDKQLNPPKILDYLSELKNTFRKIFFQIYLINFDSSLKKNLIIGVSSLKTVCCERYELKGGQICPLCSEHCLTKRIPMLTKQSSSLVCRINKSVMDEENYPVFLPSGNIYSISGLNEKANQEEYLCEATQTWYPKSKAKKVFLA